jgi:hypothetical protein
LPSPPVSITEGDEITATDFSFKNPTDAKKIDLKDLEGTDALPAHFHIE